MHLKLMNFSWLMGEQLVRLVSALFVMTLVARYLGPDQFGNYAYIFALIGLLLPFANFGLDDLVMRAVAEDPPSASQIMRRAVFFRAGMALIAATAAIASTQFAITPAGVNPKLVALASLALFAAPIETFFHVVKALERVKRVVIMRTSIAFATTAITIWSVLNGAALAAFVAIRGCEALLLAAAAWLGFKMLRQTRGPAKAATFRTSDGFPLMLASLATVVYMRIDQVMLGSMAEARELGQYGVAVRIVEALNFVMYAIQSTLFSSAVRNFKKSPETFDIFVQRIFDAHSLAGWTAMIFVGLFGTFLLVPVFGPKFAGALPMLAILLIGVPFLFLNQAWSAMLTVRGWLWTAPVATAFGATTNILLNLILIPVLGGRGAAIATVVSYVLTGIGISAIVPRLRHSARAMIKALNPVEVSFRTYRLYMAEVRGRT
jgi:O-antigen/teichoic acid export membrane protein